MNNQGIGQSGSRKNSVLIVDDSKQNIDSLRSILEDDYTVYVATNGESGLRLMQRTNPDIVLLDVVMPDLDGFGVLEIMRATPATLKMPVIFISSETGFAYEQRGLKLGAFDYIGKPYDPQIIKIKVRNQIANKLYRDELEATVADKTRELRMSHQAVIMGMSLLAESRDKGTGEHIMRMQRYTEILAFELNTRHPELISVEYAEKTVLYAPLHDIGKVCIPDSILLKPGKLTDDEFEMIKAHTTYGAEILRKTEGFMAELSESLEIAIGITESHHEKFNGGGYPHGLIGEDIPMAARIVTIADIYDALTSRRDYKDAYTHDRACDIILKGDGRTMPEHFDPFVLESFVNVMDKFRDTNRDTNEDFIFKI